MSSQKTCCCEHTEEYDNWWKMVDEKCPNWTAMDYNKDTVTVYYYENSEHQGLENALEYRKSMELPQYQVKVCNLSE